MKATPRARAKRGEGERTAEAILDAADELLIGSGSEDAVSIRGVADAVGLTPAAIYRHFPDKQGLLFAVCARHFDSITEDVAVPALASTEDPILALRQLAEAYVRFGVEHPEHYRIMFMRREDHRPDQYAAEKVLETGLFGAVLPVVQRGIDEGRFRADVTDPLLIAWVLWMGVHGITSAAVAMPNFPAPPLEVQLTATVDALLHGLLAD
ncbi:TetR/AcrR family transcriptional regulator [Aquihabitans daechungensis]|uniref:TetR/AcrR family transcriptional regulator n=1 Tax=Aquihabitans daechungensis TaxID=1052257 RepID=UPI003BA3B328